MCERCYCGAVPAADLLPRRRSPRPRERRREPTAFEQLHGRVWTALERFGTVFPACDGTGRLAGYCPACGLGTVLIRLIRTDPPRLRIDPCSDGCTPGLIADAIP